MDYPIEQLRGVMSAIADFALHGLPSLDVASVKTKQDAADFVSNRDLVMEAKILEEIHRAFPEHTVISEEIGTVGSREAEHIWLVDPIDGSCNDSHGIPWCCVSVAYVHLGKVVAGLIVHPDTKEVFEAVRGHGATRNGRQIRSRDVHDLAGTVVMSELLNQTPWPGMLEFMTHLSCCDSTIRIMGSSALAITQVAAGRAAAAVLGGAGALDVAASLLIAAESGAVIVHEGQTMDHLPLAGFGNLVVAVPGVQSTVVGILNQSK